MGFFCLSKLHLNRIRCVEVGSDGLEVFPKHLLQSNILFILLLLSCNPHYHQLSLIFQNVDYLSDKFFYVKILGYVRLMDSSSRLRSIKYMWSVVALNIDTFDNLFFMVSTEPGREVCRKALH